MGRGRLFSCVDDDLVARRLAKDGPHFGPFLPWVADFLASDSRGRSRTTFRTLRTPTCTPTAHTPIATPIARHDAAAEAARRGVAQVHDFTQSVGGVDGTGRWSLVVRRW